MIPLQQPKYKIGDKFELTIPVKHTGSMYETEIKIWCVVYGISIRHRHSYPPRYIYAMAAYRPQESPVIVGEYAEEALGENPPAVS